MTRDDFWKLIEKSRPGSEEIEEQVDNLQGLVEKLDVQEMAKKFG